jgi:hypothetical protein
MKKLKIAMLCLIGFSMQTNAQDLQVNQMISPADAVTIAQHELPNMLQLIEPEDLQEYGFDLADNFAKVQIGRPFYTAILPRTEGNFINEKISVNAHTIMLPLILNGTARCILYVSPEEGKWKVVGIGEGHFVANQQNVFNTSTNDDGTSQVIISVPQTSQQYLMETSNSFKPLFQFEGSEVKTISLQELIAINNAKPLEANEIETGNQTIEQPNSNK